MYIYMYIYMYVRTFKFNSLSKFQLHNTVLSAIVTMFYIRSSDLIHLIGESLYSYQPLPIFPTLSPWHPLFHSLFL